MTCEVRIKWPQTKALCYVSERYMIAKDWCVGAVEGINFTHKRIAKSIRSIVIKRV